MDNETLIKKADIALADLANGGKLNPEMSDKFIRKVIDQPTLIKEVRTVPMSGPKRTISKIGFGKRLLRKARQTAGSRALTAAERYKPDFGKVDLETTEFIAELNIPYEVLEDNIERGDLKNTILALIAERAALDFEELLLRGDTAFVSGLVDPDEAAMETAYLSSMDGVLKKVSSHQVNGTDVGITAELWNSTMKAMPEKYRRNQSANRLYVTPNVELDYRLAISNRGTGLGDAILTGTQALPVFGVPMKGAALMPSDKALFLPPQNIIFGLQRDISMEFDKDIRERVYIIVLTCRAAIAIEEEDACVKVNNIGAVTP